jgi:hypothetical protein
MELIEEFLYRVKTIGPLKTTEGSPNGERNYWMVSEAEIGFADARTFPMLAVDNQATGLLFIHNNIRRRIDAHRAFRALFPRGARTRSAPPVHLVASKS